VQNLKSRAKMQFASHILSGPPSIGARIFANACHYSNYLPRFMCSEQMAWHLAHTTADTQRERRQSVGWTKDQRTKTDNHTIALGQPERHPHKNLLNVPFNGPQDSVKLIESASILFEERTKSHTQNKTSLRPQFND